MSRIAAAGSAACLGLLILGSPLPAPDRVAAQDIAGVEDCTKTSGLDKRTGCLQSNVNFLQQLVTKNALDARQRLNAAAGEIAALKSEVTALKSTLASLQTSLEQLKAAQSGDKKPEPKKPDAK